MSRSAYSDDSRLYANANFEGDVAVFDLSSGAEVDRPEPGQRRSYTAMTFSSDGTHLAAAGEGIVSVWSLGGSEAPVDLGGLGGVASDLALDADGSRLALVSGSRVALFDLEHRYRLAEEVLEPEIYLPASVVRVAKAAFSADGRLVAWLHPGPGPPNDAGVDQRALVRDVESGELRADLPLTEIATAIALAPDGGSLRHRGEAVDLLPLDGGPSRRVAEPAGELVDELGFSPDGSLLTVVWRDGAIARYDVETGQRLVDVEATLFTPVSALATDGALVRLIDPNTGPVLEADLTAADPSPRQTSDGANGTVVTTIGPGGIRGTAFSDGVVGVGGGEAEPFRFQLASAPTSLSFSPDGRSLVAAASDGMVTVRDVATRTEVARLRVRDLGNEPLAAAFRPAGEPMVAVAAVDGSLTVWRVGTEAALAEACRVAARNLTLEEWDRYVGSSRPRTKTCPAFPLDE